MGEFIGPSNSGFDVGDIQKGVEDFLAHQPVMDVAPSAFSPYAYFKFPIQPARVAIPTEIPSRAQFKPEDREALLKRGLVIANIGFERGMMEANTAMALKVSNPDLFQDYLVGDAPRITQVAFYPNGVSFLEEANLGRSFKDHEIYAEMAGTQLARSMRAEGRIVGVIGSASEMHQGLAQFYAENNRLPINDLCPPIRTSTAGPSGLGLSIKVNPQGNRLDLIRTPKHTGVGKDQKEIPVVAWPLFMPAGAIDR